jgi:hypothetical protein
LRLVASFDRAIPREALRLAQHDGVKDVDADGAVELTKNGFRLTYDILERGHLLLPTRRSCGSDEGAWIIKHGAGQGIHSHCRLPREAMECFFDIAASSNPSV